MLFCDGWKSHCLAIIELRFQRSLHCLRLNFLFSLHIVFNINAIVITRVQNLCTSNYNLKNTIIHPSNHLQLSITKYVEFIWRGINKCESFPFLITPCCLTYMVDNNIQLSLKDDMEHADYRLWKIIIIIIIKYLHAFQSVLKSMASSGTTVT